MKPEWLKFKRYPHIGEPLTRQKDEKWLIDYVQDESSIANHKFTPLVHRVISLRKYRPEPGAVKNAHKKRQRSVVKKKERHIYFASHLDSVVYSYYNDVISARYEAYLEDKPFKGVAVAYRKIPRFEGLKPNKCNIDFAYDAFNYITKHRSDSLTVIVADITSFFDNLDHSILKENWARVIGSPNLPPAHFALYKNLVSKRYVNENELFKRFRHKLFVERNPPHAKPGSLPVLRRKHVKKIYNMRLEKVVAYCTKEEFYKEATDLIRVEKPHDPRLRALKGLTPLKGIPQGLPLSATLANIYMIDFDKELHQRAQASKLGAFYQRYSDDIILICDSSEAAYYYELLMRLIKELVRLEIQPTKTSVFEFTRHEGEQFVCFHKSPDGTLSRNKSLEYLGFAFNGSKVYVKSAGFSKFYRGMKRSFRRAEHFAKETHIPSNELFERRLYMRFTHIGAKRRLKYVVDQESKSGFRRVKQQNYTNFIGYLDKANAVMRQINQDDSIRMQYSKVWKKFHRLKASSYAEIDRVTNLRVGGDSGHQSSLV